MCVGPLLSFVWRAFPSGVVVRRVGGRGWGGVGVLVPRSLLVSRFVAWARGGWVGRGGVWVRPLRVRVVGRGVVLVLWAEAGSPVSGDRCSVCGWPRGFVAGGGCGC